MTEETEQQVLRSFEGMLPLVDVLERIAYVDAALRGDEERLQELEEKPGVEDMREELEDLINEHD